MNKRRFFAVFAAVLTAAVLLVSCNLGGDSEGDGDKKEGNGIDYTNYVSNFSIKVKTIPIKS